MTDNIYVACKKCNLIFFLNFVILNLVTLIYKLLTSPETESQKLANAITRNLNFFTGNSK